MLSGLDQAPDVHRKLAALTRAALRPEAGGSSRVALIAECFRLSLSRSAIYVLREQFDVHDADQAKLQPKLFTDAVDKISGLFRALVDTPFDAKRSMFDVTTVMVASEFGRTMRAPDMPIDRHRHQPQPVRQLDPDRRQGHSRRPGDRRIRPAPTRRPSARRRISAIDPVLEKVMGRPFDFKTPARRGPTSRTPSTSRTT